MLNKIKLIGPFKCELEDNTVDVAKKLRDSVQRHIYVVDNELPVGIISTTDINNKIVAEGKDPNKIKAKDIMSQPIEFYDIDQDAVEVYKEMIANKRLTAAVVNDKKFVGILTLNRVISYITSHGGLK